YQDQREGQQELEALIAAVDAAQHPLDRRSDEAEQGAGDDERRHDQPRREAGRARGTDEAHPGISAQRQEQGPGEITRLRHSEDELQSGGDQEQDGGVKDAADENVGEGDHLDLHRSAQKLLRRRAKPLRDQILNCAVLIQSQKLAPGGFCRSAAYMLSNVPSVTKSYLLLWVVRPCTNVCSAM